MTKPFRLLAFFLLLTFSSEQILFASPPTLCGGAFPGEGSASFASPTGSPARLLASQVSREERPGISTHFSSPQNPHIGEFEGLPKISSLKQAGWFKKLFKKIAKFFKKVVQAIVKVLQKVVQALQKFMQTGFGKVVGNFLGVPLLTAALNIAINTFSYLGQGDIKGLFKYWSQN